MALILAVVTTVALVTVSAVSPAVQLAADKTALVMGGVTVPTPDEAYIDAVNAAPQTYAPLPTRVAGQVNGVLVHETPPAAPVP